MAIGVGTALLGSSIISGLGGLIGGKTQADAAKQAAANQMAQFEATREDLSPYRDGGQRGLDAYMSELGFGESGYNAPSQPDFSYSSVADGFQESPGYGYAMDQMQRAVQNSASARGNLHSGATQLELMRHANGLASQDFNNYMSMNRQGMMDNYNVRQQRLSRLESLAGMGAQAATQTGQFGANATSNAGNMQMQGAGAMAGGIAAGANAATGYVNNMMNYGLMQQALNPGAKPSGAFSNVFAGA